MIIVVSLESAEGTHDFALLLDFVVLLRFLSLRLSLFRFKDLFFSFLTGFLLRLRLSSSLEELRSDEESDSESESLSEEESV